MPWWMCDNKGAFFISFPFFPKRITVSFLFKKKKITFLTLVQQKCDIVHPFLDRSALLFCFCFRPYWWGVDGLHCYQIGTLTSEHPRWEMHWRWAFLSETDCLFFFFFLLLALHSHALSLSPSFFCRLTLHFVVLTLL